MGAERGTCCQCDVPSLRPTALPSLIRGISTFGSHRQEPAGKIFRSRRVHDCDSLPPDDSRGAVVMARDEKGFRIGFFGDVRREEAGATLFERVVETGSLVLRQVGGNRAGEMAAHRFLSSPHVSPEEILA